MFCELTYTSFCEMSVLRGGKLHPLNAAVLKLLALLANSASKVPCQWVVIERNGSYRLISCVYNRRSTIAGGVFFFCASIYIPMQQAPSSKRRRVCESYFTRAYFRDTPCRSRSNIENSENNNRTISE